jgi:branched-subunit amino acid ABC-type transport system permease component
LSLFAGDEQTTAQISRSRTSLSHGLKVRATTANRQAAQNVGRR